MKKKFRCFDKQFKTMHMVTMLLLDTNELDHDGNFNEPKMMYHFEVTESIGKPCKNKNQVFVGDILEGKRLGNKIERSVIVWDNDMSAYLLRPMPFSDTYAGHTIGTNDLLDYTIIGNIYENPDLIIK